MTSQSRLGALVAVCLLATAIVLPQTQVAAEVVSLPGTASASPAACDGAAAQRGPLGY